MQTDPLVNDNSDPVIDVIGILAMAVGLVFLSLALLTFVLCRRNPRVTNTARINLCISLLLAHLLFLLTQKFLHNIQPQQLLCAVLAGILHFFFLSAFVWMFIDAALLFISMKNLTKIRSNEKAGLLWKLLVVIGYAVPLFVVGVSAGVFPNGYGSERCWLKTGFLWSFLGPVSFILAANTILFICILIIIISTLTNMKSKSLKIKRPESEHRFIISVALKTMSQFIILGCSWFLGYFAQSNKALEIIFLFLNSQQGTFIFLVYCVLSQEVRQLYMKWWRALHAGRIPHTTEDLHTTTSRF
ncbi:adhesion G protein-coupled receptor E3-like [Colossoma macropomum]|uniref:adhesion G protein-coupled receptor E3-like n=1 Tax=Colossoma macropomum TaxID=42526 RepID=UPI0018651D63|nr:adhesion G protein-coupled receptor E3-like [Colossoma macropomum]